MWILFLIILAVMIIPGIYSSDEHLCKILFVYEDEHKNRKPSASKETVAKKPMEDLDSSSLDVEEESLGDNNYDHSKKAEELLDRIKHEG